MYDCRFLDLFSGSGGIGNRGAEPGSAGRPCLWRTTPGAMACIKENLRFTRLEGRAVTMTRDVMNALYQLEGEKTFDFIFMDPPYDRGLEKTVLEYLAGSELVYEDTVIIAEASKETDFSYAERLGFEVTREKLYKTNKHVFLVRAGKGRNMLRAVYPGSFDPVTYGHYDIVLRSARSWTN